MKSLIVLLAICAMGYGVDHWQELTNLHPTTGGDTHALVIYGTKSCEAYVRLEGQLAKRGIPYTKCDLSKDENYRALMDARARVGKVGGKISIPVADVDGVVLEGATFEQIAKLLH